MFHFKKIKKHPVSLRNALKKIKKNNKGVALIEFAFGLPIMLLAGIAGLETVNYILVHQQLSQLAMLVADNAARTIDQMDEVSVNEIFFGADATAGQIDIGENGRIVLTQLTHNGLTGADEGNWVRWQRCYGELGASSNLRSAYGRTNDGRFDGSLANGFGTATNQIAATPTSPINFVEIYYDYQPLINNPITNQFFEQGERITYTAAFVVRERLDQRLSNISGLPNSQRFFCGSHRSF